MDLTAARDALGDGWIVIIILLFVGVLYWGFGGQRRRRGKTVGNPPDDSDRQK